MVRVEPQTVDVTRWPSLVPPTHSSKSVGVAEALRRSAHELGLRIDYPDDSAAGEFDAPARIAITDTEHFWARLVSSGVTGLAESYMAGEWHSPHLATALGVLLPWVATHPDCSRSATRNVSGRTRARSAHAITDIEDGLPGDLCALYTDETMATSSALFSSGARTRSTTADGLNVVRVQAPSPPPRRSDLADAQRRSMDVLLGLAGVEDNSRAVVAPPGWGELPMRAAEQGARVRAVTSSADRLAMLGARFAAAQLSEAITLSLGRIDELSGTVDAVIAVDPSPARGLAGVEAVVRLADRLLRPQGRLVLHTTLAAATDGAVGSTLTEIASWQREYISDTAPVAGWRQLTELVTNHPRLHIAGTVDVSSHHAETIRLWSENFAVRGRDAAALGFDAVYRRMWAFHLAALEARLRQNWAQTVHVVVKCTESHH